MSFNLGRFLPRAALRQLHREFEQAMIAKRRRVDSGLPRPKLRAEHLRNCRLLVDWAELVSNLPGNGRVPELGVDHGDFSKLILETTRPETLHLVDIWGSERYGQDLFELVGKRFAPQRANGQVVVYRKLSTQAVNDFEDDYFDWIYIDTDRSYGTTHNELKSFSPKVKRDGSIAGDDYVKGNWATGLRYGVMEAVHDFCINQSWDILFLTASLAEFNSFAIRRIGV